MYMYSVYPMGTPLIPRHLPPDSSVYISQIIKNVQSKKIRANILVI